MKDIIKLHIIVIIGILVIFADNNLYAQQKQHKRAKIFIDANGDGYNDNAPDHDGDGIPNGLDPDYSKKQNRKMHYIDANGDGINDLLQNNDQTNLQSENMRQNKSSESMLNNDEEVHKSHQRNKRNK